MNKRSIIAAVLMVLGLILTAGAVSGSEYGDLSFKDSIVYGIVGAALLVASVPISGDLKRGDNDEKVREERQRNKGRGRSDC